VSPWFSALLEIGGRLIPAYLVAFLAFGILWRTLGPHKRFPHRTIVIVALVLTAPRVVEQITVATRQLPESAIAAEAEVANRAFLGAFNLSATREDVRTQIAGLSIDRWPAGAAEFLADSLLTKAHRYSDIHQSMTTGRIVRTTIPGAGPYVDELRSIDDAHWTPLLEAAARGEVVRLPDATLADPSESWLLAVTATRARIMVTQALNEFHGLSLSLLHAEEELATAFDWIEDFVRITSGVGSLDALSEQADVVDRVVNAQDVSPSDVDALKQLLASDVASSASYVLNTWATSFVELATDRWIARVALGESPRSTIVRLNSYRAVLGLPILHNDVVAEARSTKMMPSWAGAAPDEAGRPLDAVLAEATAGLRTLEMAVASLAPAWAPPVIDLD
jgi:hypothetical protein